MSGVAGVKGDLGGEVASTDFGKVMIDTRDDDWAGALDERSAKGSSSRRKSGGGESLAEANEGVSEIEDCAL